MDKFEPKGPDRNLSPHQERRMRNEQAKNHLRHYRQGGYRKAQAILEALQEEALEKGTPEYTRRKKTFGRLWDELKNESEEPAT